MDIIYDSKAMDIIYDSCHFDFEKDLAKIESSGPLLPIAIKIQSTPTSCV